jgi:hypothetical protein
MRGFLIACGLVLATAAPATAQMIPNSVRYETFVEERRPRIEKRPLTSEEQAVVKRWTAELKKGKSIAILRLDELRPMGDAGDKAAMRALFDGFSNGAGSGWQYGDVASRSLRGLWAVELWRAGERGRDLAQAMIDCVEYDRYQMYFGNLKGVGCGFDLYVHGNAELHLGAYAKGKGKPPKQIDIKEVALVRSIEEEKARFEKILSARKSASEIEPADYRWALAFAERQGPEQVERWNNAALDNSRSQEAKTAAATAEQNRKIAEWTTLEAKWRAARAGGEAFADDDYARLYKVSFQLLGKYLEPYASEHYLKDQTLIDSLCRAKSGAVCDRQRQILELLAHDARQEALDRELKLRNLTMGGSTVATRSYDQNGNYLGSSTMPAWQAEILKGN